MSNITIGDTTPLSMVSGFLDPIGQFMGLDGVILTAFILGFPANEIVVPIMIMAYTKSGLMQEASSLLQLKELLVANGWSCPMYDNILSYALALRHHTPYGKEGDGKHKMDCCGIFSADGRRIYYLFPYSSYCRRVLKNEGQPDSNIRVRRT